MTTAENHVWDAQREEWFVPGYPVEQSEAMQAMDDFIQAMEVFLRYLDSDSWQYRYPFQCEHDVLFVMVDPELVSDVDMALLDNLGFRPSDSDSFQSYRFGSA